MKVFVTYFAHESNSFSPIPTSVDNFRAGGIYLPSTGEGEHLLEEDFTDDTAFIAYLRARGHEVIVGPLAGATPSAPLNQAAYEFIRGEILGTLGKAGPVDAVLMFLHGAQLAYGCDDCEGDLLQRIRAIVGPNVPVGVELDLHCNLTEKMLDNADVILACKEYPHTDFAAQGERLVELVEQTAAKTCVPTMAYVPVPMLGYFFSNREPLRGFIDDIVAMERRENMLSISICHGFGLSDTHHSRSSVLVITDDDQVLAEKTANELAMRFFAMREAIKAPVVSIPQALDQALAAPPGTVVIADTTDNAGGGAASDSTFVLQALLERGIRDAAICLLWDIEAVEMAARAGVGSRIALRIGGKTSPFSGPPVDVDGVVKSVRDDACQLTFATPTPLGKAAVVEVNGIDIVLNSIRQQPMHPKCFSEMGIDPWEKRILVVKSTQHFYAHFASKAVAVIYADGPGSVTGDFAKLNYKKLQRPIWPVDQPPFRAYGRDWSG